MQRGLFSCFSLLSSSRRSKSQVKHSTVNDPCIDMCPASELRGQSCLWTFSPKRFWLVTEQICTADLQPLIFSTSLTATDVFLFSGKNICGARFTAMRFSWLAWLHLSHLSFQQWTLFNFFSNNFFAKMPPSHTINKEIILIGWLKGGGKHDSQYNWSEMFFVCKCARTVGIVNKACWRKSYYRGRILIMIHIVGMICLLLSAIVVSHQ